MIAITGTPGTGKSSMGAILASRGREIIELGDLIKKHALHDGMDEERGSLEVDPDYLAERLPDLLPDGEIVLIGHLAHLVGADLIIVLRCSPSVLERRLEARGWSEAKVRENMEAEALDVILVEAVESEQETLEIDTTDMTPAEVADAVEEILAGEREKYAVGNIDWSQEVLGWY
ncbi:MAG: adenylate kinase family protein [Methanomassiliicoccus sp.]|nr:adenylate kinase family protein [Methanomassiliicoccus sp.]